MENNYGGRADSLSMKALCRRFDLIHADGFCSARYGSCSWVFGPPVKHEKVEIVIMAGSARPTFNFSQDNSRGGCSTENGKRKTENISEQAITAGLKRGKGSFRPGGFRTVIWGFYSL